jgi:hypothetical protein
MPEEIKTEAIPSSEEMHNYDATLLLYQTRDAIAEMNVSLLTKDGRAYNAYIKAINFMKQLFDVARLSIRNSGKVSDWDKKEKLYNYYINERLFKYINPTVLNKIWKLLSEDIADAGIYEKGSVENIIFAAKLTGEL